METIIVQETDRDVLDILTVALREGGFNVFALIDCDDNFLDLIDKIRPHVVILDYRFSGDKSIIMCKLIKAKYPNLPVIALSCNNNINDVYSRHGFTDYIKKPFDLDVLYKILRKHIPKQEANIDKQQAG